MSEACQRGDAGTGLAMDKDRKRELKRRGKALLRERANTEWDEHMVLEPEQLRALLDHLDERLTQEPCDHTLRGTRDWAKANGVDAEALESSVVHFGGGCDCEVLANVDPETDVDGWPRYAETLGR
jgi:hypothetical protein